VEDAQLITGVLARSRAFYNDSYKDETGSYKSRIKFMRREWRITNISHDRYVEALAYNSTTPED
jgi:hypothetical protein